MTFDNLVWKRKSVRAFKRKSVNYRLLLDAIDVANQGPFANNNNHLKYLIVEDSDTIYKVAEISEQDFIQDAPVLILVCSDDTKLEDVFGLRGRVYSRQQAGAAIYALMLRLQESGIGSCWVGAYSDVSMRRVFGIPDNFQVEAVVAVGYSADKKNKVKKRSLVGSVNWEKWGKMRKPTNFEERGKDFGT